MKPSFDDADLLLTVPKIIVIGHLLLVIVENVVTCLLGHSVHLYTIMLVECRKRSCEYNLGGHCETENAASLAAQWHYLNSPWSPGRRKRLRPAARRRLKARRHRRDTTVHHRPLCSTRRHVHSLFHGPIS